MKRSRFGKSFFIEMAMVVLFFSLAVAVIIRFFAQGALLSEKSKAVNGVILAAQLSCSSAALGLFQPTRLS